MYTAARRIAAFIFLLIASAPFLFSFKYLVDEKLIRMESEERMKEEKLQTVTLRANAIRWARYGKEIILDGKYFDIRTYTVQGELATLTGHFDEKESNLQEEYKEATEDAGNRSLHEAVLKFLILPDLAYPEKDLANAGWQIVHRHYGRFTESLPVPPALSLIQPPRS